MYPSFALNCMPGYNTPVSEVPLGPPKPVIWSLARDLTTGVLTRLRRLSTRSVATLPEYIFLKNNIIF